MNLAVWEKNWPALLAVCATVVTGCLAAFVFHIKSFPIPVPAATMTFGVVVAGFAATQRNMLLTMSGSEVLRFALRTGYYEDVISYLTAGIRSGLLVTLVSVCGFFLGENNISWIIWFSFLVGGITWVLGLIARNEKLVGLLVRRFLEDQRRESTSP